MILHYFVLNKELNIDNTFSQGKSLPQSVNLLILFPDFLSGLRIDKIEIKFYQKSRDVKIRIGISAPYFYSINFLNF